MTKEVVSIFSVVREFIFPIILVIITAFFQSAFKNFNFTGRKQIDLQLLNEINNSKLDETIKSITNNYFTKNLITKICGISLKQEQFILIEKSGLPREFDWKVIKRAIKFFKFNENGFEIKINTFDKIFKWAALILYVFTMFLGYIALYSRFT